MANKIESKITGYKVKDNNIAEPIEQPVYILPEREEVLNGITIKVKPSTSDHAYYVTVNFQNVNGSMRPFEVFIRTKDIQFQEWITILTRSLSAIFRRGGDYSFIIEEMKNTYSPSGGYWGKLNGKGFNYPSLIANFGYVIEQAIQTYKV